MNSKCFQLHQIPQKANDLLSFFGMHHLTYSFNQVIHSLKSIPPTFAIKTKSNEFKCHIEIAAVVSNAICKAINLNSHISEFSLADDFDDSKFDQIANFLNGSPIKITNENCEYITYAFQSLEIDQNLFDLNCQKEITLKSFSHRFYDNFHDINNFITITNAKGSKYQVNYLLASSYCNVLRKNDQQNIRQLNFDTSTDFSDVSDFLNGKSLNINFDNINAIKECFHELQITSFDSIINVIEASYKLLNPIVSAINLQDTILDINEEKMNEIYEILVNSDYYCNPNMHNELLLTLEISFTYRPHHYQSIINLISLLQNNSSIFHNSLISYLKNRYFSLLLSIPFLRSIYDSKIITLEEVFEIIKNKSIQLQFDYSLIEKQSQINTDTLLFFASELIDNDEEQFMEDIKSQRTYESTQKLQKLKDYLGNWNEYSNLMHLYRRPGNLCAAIYNDDVDSLQTISSHQPNFDFDQKLEPSIFEPFDEIDCIVSLADLAAFYGSVRCFKYLKLQNADLSDCAKYAIYGGNYEIIRLIEQEGNKFNGLLYCAVKYHRYDIFKWLYLKNGSMEEVYKTNYDSGKQPLLPLSISNYNYRVFLELYEKGIDNSKVDKVSLTLIGKATLALNSHALKLLATTYMADINSFVPKNSVTPIYYAAACNCLEVVKILAESPKIIFPKEAGNNPLFIAAEKGEVEIVEYLAPFYKDVINEDYLAALKDIDPKIKDIILSVTK